MSTGHLADHGDPPGEIKRTAALAAIDGHLKAKRKVDRSYDLPYLAGYSRDGKTIYIDRHLPKQLQIGKRLVSIDRFLEVHEAVEKCLIDELNWGYWPSHHVATHAENDAVRKAGISPHAYERVLKPYIKADEHERLIRVPADLDLTPYEAKPVDAALLRHLKRKMGLPLVKDTKAQANYGPGMPEAHCGICEYFAAPSSCEQVRGLIDPSMWCRHFEKEH